MTATPSVSITLLAGVVLLSWDPQFWEWKAMTSCLKGIALVEDCRKQFDHGIPSDATARARLRNEVNEGLSYLYEGTTAYEMLTEEYGWSHDASRFDQMKKFAHQMADDLAAKWEPTY